MSEQTSPTPQARIFRLQDLPGRTGKSIRVPTGRLGIAIYPDGKVRTFSEGEHTVLTPWQRISGKGAGLQSGYLPAGDLMVHLNSEYLLSGDGVLLDCNLVCLVEIAEPERFFREVVIPRGELRTSILDMDAQLYKNALGALTPQYAASDLASGRLNTRLLDSAQTSLDATLQPQGLRLKEIRLLTISRSENRAVIAEKAQALHERLQDVEIQRKMAEVENQTQLDEFLHQVAPEVGPMVAVDASVGDQAPSQAGKIGATVQGWLNSITGRLDKTRPQIEKLFRRQQKEQAVIPKTPRHPKRWWLPRVRWILAIILVGVILTQLFNWAAEKAGWENTTEVMIIIWGFVITGVLESLKNLFEKWEAVSEDLWIQYGYQHLDDLVAGDRKQVDLLVREQCASEIRHIKNVISDIRTQEYQRGNMEMALELKKSLESNLDNSLEKILNSDYAQPPYVTDLQISQRAWENMVDNDEDLLLYINALAEKASLLKQKSHRAELTPDMVTDMNVSLSVFDTRFFERGRYLQMPGVEPVRK